jgi:hypothetical protein
MPTSQTCTPLALKGVQRNAAEAGAETVAALQARLERNVRRDNGIDGDLLTIRSVGFMWIWASCHGSLHELL